MTAKILAVQDADLTAQVTMFGELSAASAEGAACAKCLQARRVGRLSVRSPSPIIVDPSQQRPVIPLLLTRTASPVGGRTASSFVWQDNITF